jgi:hypothetical protein
MNKKIFAFAAPLALVAGLAIISPFPALAQTAGTVPENVQSGIDDSIATVEALENLALAALVVALTPLGAMLTLRFLNMVLSRV